MSSSIARRNGNHLNQKKPTTQFFYTFTLFIMAFYAPKTEQKEFQSVASGTYVGRCYSFIDLGTQTIQSQYGEQQKHQIRLSFELPEELIEIKGEQKPYSVHMMLTLSTHEKSQLMALLKARQNVTEASTFDLTNLVGKE